MSPTVALNCKKKKKVYKTGEEDMTSRTTNIYLHTAYTMGSSGLLRKENSRFKVRFHTSVGWQWGGNWEHRKQECLIPLVWCGGSADFFLPLHGAIHYPVSAAKSERGMHSRKVFQDAGHLKKKKGKPDAAPQIWIHTYHFPHVAPHSVCYCRCAQRIELVASFAADSSSRLNWPLQNLHNLCFLFHSNP